MNVENLIIKTRNSIARYQRSLTESESELELANSLKASNSVKNRIVTTIGRQRQAIADAEAYLKLLTSSTKK